MLVQLVWGSSCLRFNAPVGELGDLRRMFSQIGEEGCDIDIPNSPVGGAGAGCLGTGA